MTTLTEAPRTGEFIVSELPGTRSREQVTVASGEGIVPAGRVMAQVVATSTVTSGVKASGANTGNGTFVLNATPALARVQLGIYRLRCITVVTNGGVFELTDPAGRSLGQYVIPAGAGNSIAIANQIQGTLTDGATDFIVGDGFDITVSAVTFNHVRHNPAGTNGSQIATGILYRGVDATSAAQRSVIVARGAETNGNTLTWSAGITAAQRALAISQLAELGITVRN